MSSKYTVADVVPHSGKMSLLSEIVDYGEDWLKARVNIKKDSMFSDGEGVPAWVGLEYLAQTVAAYAGLLEREQGCLPKIGFLLGTRKYECTQDKFLIGQTLELKVELEFQGENGLASYRCYLESEGVKADAWINVYQPNSREELEET